MFSIFAISAMQFATKGQWVDCKITAASNEHIIINAIWHLLQKIDFSRCTHSRIWFGGVDLLASENVKAKHCIATILEERQQQQIERKKDTNISH